MQPILLESSYHGAKFYTTSINAQYCERLMVFDINEVTKSYGYQEKNYVVFKAGGFFFIEQGQAKKTKKVAVDNN